MSTKAYITRASLSYRVIVFSFLHEEPLDISPFVTRVSGSTSKTDSQSNEFNILIRSPAVSLLFQKGDWIQIDLEMPQYETEHIFFGQVMSITGNESVASAGSGLQEVATIQALSWGSVFERFVSDLKTYLRVNADTLFPWRDEIKQAPASTEQGGKPKLQGLDEVSYETPPSLASIAQGKLTAHPWQAVSMVLHHLCRYGGTMGQQFWLPTSFTGLTELVPLIEYVGRINKTRLPNGEVMDSGWQGFDSDANNTIVQIEKRDVEDGSFKTDVPEDDRGWSYSDWHNTFAANKAFVPGHGFLRDFITFDLRQTLSDLALDLSDSAFNELTYTLQEHCTLGPQNPTEAVIPMSGKTVPFSRDFIMTVVLRPIPHPTWDSAADTIKAQSGDNQFMLTASNDNYNRLCSKFVLGLGHASNAQFHQSVGNAFSYFNVVPQDQELRTFEDFDAAAMLRYTSGRVPIIDEELMQTFGHLPMVTQTRYHFGGGEYYVSPTSGPAPFVIVEDTLDLPNPTGPGSVRFKRDVLPYWMVLASKALALYSWHAKGWEHYDGTISTPIVDTNVPRPGDVGYLVAHRSDQGSHFRNANRKWFEPKIVAKMLTTGAISVYVDAVDYDIVMGSDTSVVKGSLTIHFSHGVWCETVNPPNAESLPYKRFVDYGEVGIDPVYFLPPTDGAVELKEELFTEFSQISVVDAKELVKEIEGDKDETRNKNRRKRARRRRKKRGLRKTEPKSTNSGGTGMSFSLVSYEAYEPPAETRKTRRNPTKKTTGGKVYVSRTLIYNPKPTAGEVLLGPLYLVAVREGKRKIEVTLPVKTNKYGEVDKRDADKQFSIFMGKTKDDKGPSLK